VEDRRRAEAELERAKAQLSEAQALLAKTYIRSPIDGVVLRRKLKTGRVFPATEIRRSLRWEIPGGFAFGRTSMKPTLRACRLDKRRMSPQRPMGTAGFPAKWFASARFSAERMFEPMSRPKGSTPRFSRL
jgi:hypothetical protein